MRCAASRSCSRNARSAGALGQRPQLALEHVDESLRAGARHRALDPAKQRHDERHHRSPDDVVARPVPAVDGRARQPELRADGLDVDSPAGEEAPPHDVQQLLLRRGRWTTPHSRNAITGHRENATCRGSATHRHEEEALFQSVAGAELAALGYETRGDGAGAGLRAPAYAVHDAALRTVNFVRLRIVQERGREVRHVLRRKLAR